MNRFTFVMFGRTLSLSAAIVVAGLSSGTFAQDSSFVPIAVNTDATVTAVPKSADGGAETVVLEVEANKTDTLRLPYVMTTSVIYFGGQRRANAPTVAANRGGNVTVNLPARSYKSAEIALYTANGKRVMCGMVSSSNAVNNISRRNVATGVYLLSVRGAGGEAVTARLTHSGGGLSINTAFTGGSGADARKLAKDAADLVAMTWTVTVSAENWKDSAFAIQPGKWNNNPLNTITLTLDPPKVVKSTFTDWRDGTVYKKITLTREKAWSATWMAENLNYVTRNLSGNGAWCYDDSDAGCAKYGALYNWATAQTVCPLGWHLPTLKEWGALSKAAGGNGFDSYGNGGTAGKVLKSTSGWENDSVSYNGTDDFGFSALPGGSRSSDGNFKNAGFIGFWWTTTADADQAYGRFIGDLSHNYDSTYEPLSWFHGSKNIGCSVRCVQD